MRETSAAMSTDMSLALLMWNRGLRDTTVPAFFPLYADTHRYLVLKGGGGSGKSVFAARKLLERAVSERGHRLLVIRKVSRTIRESCLRLILSEISEHYPHLVSGEGYIFKGTEHTIKFPHTGSEIIFSGIDDPEKLKSIYGITGIWIEEASELSEDDFDQLDIRLRDSTKYYKQIILTFNPVSVTHWLKRRFFDRVDARATISETTYKDNPFLGEEAIATLEAFRETNPYYYNVYALGAWGVTGRCVFDQRALSRRLEADLSPVARGYFEYETDDAGRIESFRFCSSPDGILRIYKKPSSTHPYVIGADTAGDGADRSAAQVIDNTDGTQVAVMLCVDIDEDEFTRQLYCLGIYYNEALVGVETNFSTYPIRELERLRYPRQYIREAPEDFTHRRVNSYGFRTDQRTRPMLISNLIAYVRDHSEGIADADTIYEMLTFVRGESLRAEASYGAHDDLVMALGIAHIIRDSQSSAVRNSTGMVEWTRAMYEDYKNASARVKEHLREIWGTPPKRKR